MAAEKENRLTRAEVKAWLQNEFGSSDDRKIPASEYDRACAFVEGK